MMCNFERSYVCMGAFFGDTQQVHFLKGEILREPKDSLNIEVHELTVVCLFATMKPTRVYY